MMTRHESLQVLLLNFFSWAKLSCCLPGILNVCCKAEVAKVPILLSWNIDDKLENCGPARTWLIMKWKAVLLLLSLL